MVYAYFILHIIFHTEPPRNQVQPRILTNLHLRPWRQHLAAHSAASLNTFLYCFSATRDAQRDRRSALCVATPLCQKQMCSWKYCVPTQWKRFLIKQHAKRSIFIGPQKHQGKLCKVPARETVIKSCGNRVQNLYPHG